MAFTRVCVHDSGAVDRSDRRESSFAACLAAAAARPTRAAFLFYDRVRTESVQMKDRESPRLKIPRDAWKQPVALEAVWR